VSRYGTNTWIIASAFPKSAEATGVLGRVLREKPRISRVGAVIAQELCSNDHALSTNADAQSFARLAAV
jgi:hypothetical protein